MCHCTDTDTHTTENTHEVRVIAQNLNAHSMGLFTRRRRRNEEAIVSPCTLLPVACTRTLYLHSVFGQCIHFPLPFLWCHEWACNACNIYIDKTTGSLPCTFDAHKYSHVYAYPPHFTYLLSDNRIFLWNGITVAEQSGIHQWNSCIPLATFQMTCNRFSMQTIFVLK